MAQVRRDVKLLQSLNIMDYSLLVGIHDLTRGNEEKLRDKTLQVFQPGGDRDEDASANLLTRTPSKMENARKARELRMTLKKERPVPIEQAGEKMPDEILDERKNLVFYSDDGGFRATHEDGRPAEEIYYLGIIDCLTSVSLLLSFTPLIGVGADAERWTIVWLGEASREFLEGTVAQPKPNFANPARCLWRALHQLHGRDYDVSRGSGAQAPAAGGGSCRVRGGAAAHSRSEVGLRRPDNASGGR